MRETYPDDGPGVYVRCLMCGQHVEQDWLVEHVKEECDGEPLYEDLEPIGLSSADEPAPEEADPDPDGGSASEGAGGQAKASSSPEADAEEPAPAPSPIRSVGTAKEGEQA